MNYIKIFSIFGMFYSIFSFFYLNIKEFNEGGVGYGYLAIFILFFIILFLSTIKLYSFRYIKKSTLALMIFLCYFMFNYLFDAWDLSSFKAVTIGTTSGVIFGLIIGMCLAYGNVVLYRIINLKKSYFRISFVLLFILLSYTFFISYDVLVFNMEYLRADKFLIETQEGKYQRPAVFMLMMYLTILSISTIHLILKSSLFLTLYILLSNTIVALFFMFISQLIGSNSALVTIAGLLIVFFTYIFIAKGNWLFRQKINIRNILMGKIFLKMFLFILIGLLILISLLVGLFDILDLNTDMFRITGFGANESSSMNSRIEIFKNNFIEHLSYNPIFGNTIVDTLTTGEGSYVHSLLSILTHLGMVGFVLFLTYLFFMYKDISLNNDNTQLYNLKKYSLFRIFVLGTILIYGLVSASYIWMPLWFAFGLFGTTFVIRNKEYKGVIIEKKSNINSNQ